MFQNVSSQLCFSIFAVVAAAAVVAVVAVGGGGGGAVVVVVFSLKTTRLWYKIDQH